MVVDAKRRNPGQSASGQARGGRGSRCAGGCGCLSGQRLALAERRALLGTIDAGLLRRALFFTQRE